jgi:polysaccharide export outer membrane protein
MSSGVWEVLRVILNNRANSRRLVTGAAAIAIAASLGACAQLPHEGPSRATVESVAVHRNTSGFVLINVDQKVANYLAEAREPSLGDRFGKGRPANAERIGVGDVLNIKIWEADPGGLFATAGTVDRGEIPGVVVSKRGTIKIPYAGNIQAAGRAPGQIAAAITRRLQQKTVEPQTHVTVAQNVSNVVTVTGDVNTAGVFPLSLRGDDLLDAIAAAGGSKYPSYETKIRLTRNSKSGETYLEQILKSPANNLFVQPGDQIHVERAPKTYSAFGAVSEKGRIDFGTERLTLIEGVSKASGLSDERADPTGVFLMRFEPATRAFDLAGQTVPEDAGEIVPVIYRIDFQDPNQYFFAQSIPMRDKDVIYVANALAVELDKFLQIVGRGVGAARTTNLLLR